MQVTSIDEAKTHLSELIKKTQEGEDVIICKAGKPVVKLIKYKALSSPCKAGVWKGQITIADDFDQLPDNLLSLFKGDKV